MSEVPFEKALEAAKAMGYAEAKKEFSAMLPDLVKEAVIKHYPEPIQSITSRYSPAIFGGAGGDQAHSMRSALSGDNKDGVYFGRYLRIAAASSMSATLFGEHKTIGQVAKEMYPDDAFLHKTMEKSFATNKALSVATPSAGGFLVPTEFVAEVIPLLRTIAVVRSAGCRSIPMETGSMEIPKQTGGATAFYTGENIEINASQESLGNLNFITKKLVCVVPISNDLLRSSAISADQFVRDDMLVVMALREDEAFLRGNGTASTPLGVLNTNDVQSYVLGNGNGATPDMNTLPHIMRLAKEAFSRFVKPAWIMNARTEEVFYNLKTANNVPIYREEMDKNKTLHGYPYFRSEQIPNTLTVGTSTNCSEIYFGDWNEAIIAEQSTMETVASLEASYRNSAGTVINTFIADQLVIKATSRHDFGLRQPAVFVVTTGVLPE